MSTTFKKDLKFTLKAVFICLLIALAVRSFSKIKDNNNHQENQQVEQVK